MSNFFLQITIFLFTLLLTRCANISPPTGGKKDTKAPSIKSSSPKQNELNFRDKKIQIEFDEDVNTQSVQEQLIITPYTEIPFKLNGRKNLLDITFEKPLEENTTYTLNFRESIKDMSEGNIASALTLAFSTGTYIDSNQVYGSVKTAEDNKPAKDVVVGLYESTDSISAIKNKPIYFSKTNGEGKYQIQNVKKGNYQLIAIDDKNKNLLFTDGELMAINRDINFDTTSKILCNLSINKYYLSIPEINNIKEENNTIDIKLKQSIDTFTFSTKSDVKFYPILSKDKKIINLYKTQEIKDSLQATVELIDSAGNKSTHNIKLITEKFKPEKSAIAITTEPTEKINPGEIRIGITTNKPILKINKELISLKEDSVETKIEKNKIHQINQNLIEIRTTTKAKDSLILQMEDKALESFDTTSSKFRTQWEIKKAENYSLLEIRIETKEENYIIQLVNDKNEVVSQDKNIKGKLYEFLNPGSYQLRAIIDTNKNGKWDAGNALTNQEPEKIIHMGAKLELRANWEVRDVIFKF